MTTYATGDGRFATRADLARYGLAPAVLADIPTADQDDALGVATSELGDLIGDRVTFPLSAWSPALRMHTCRAAAYHLLRAHGFNQDSSDELVLKDYDRALSWAKSVKVAFLTPAMTDATPTDDSDRAASSGISNASRRWRR